MSFSWVEVLGVHRSHVVVVIEKGFFCFLQNQPSEAIWHLLISMCRYCLRWFCLKELWLWVWLKVKPWNSDVQRSFFQNSDRTEQRHTGQLRKKKKKDLIEKQLLVTQWFMVKKRIALPFAKLFNRHPHNLYSTKVSTLYVTCDDGRLESLRTWPLMSQQCPFKTDGLEWEP